MKPTSGKLYQLKRNEHFYSQKKRFLINCHDKTILMCIKAELVQLKPHPYWRTFFLTPQGEIIFRTFVMGPAIEKNFWDAIFEEIQT